MGQLINVWTGSLPVVVITFAGDTGSFADRISLDLSHNAGPTAISAPMTKASWAVIEPEGLPAAIERALRVAMTPPVGPVHLAIYDRMLGPDQVTANIIEGDLPEVRTGYPSDGDVEQIAQPSAMPNARFCTRATVSGKAAPAPRSQPSPNVSAFRSWASCAGSPSSTRSIAAAAAMERVLDRDPDLILCFGVRHNGAGTADDYSAFFNAERIIAVGSDVENLENIPGLDLAVLADEKRTAQRLVELAGPPLDELADRRAWAREEAASLRAQRRDAARSVGQQPGKVRPYVLADALDQALERLGGGLVTIEQFAVAQDILENTGNAGNNDYIRPAGGSEGYGMGAAIGAKLGAPDKPVVGLVGDGSLYYSDSALWTAASHSIPVLYVISNNGAYGIVAGAFGGAEANMKQTGEYRGVVLDNINPVKLAEGFGVEGMDATDESKIAEAIEHGLKTVEEEKRPFLLNVHLPIGLPAGGRPGAPYSLTKDMS